MTLNNYVHHPADALLLHKSMLLPIKDQLQEQRREKRKERGGAWRWQADRGGRAAGAQGTCQGATAVALKEPGVAAATEVISGPMGSNSTQRRRGRPSAGE